MDAKISSRPIETDMDPRSVVNRLMEADLFSRWLGIEVLSVGDGTSEICMLVRPEMVNGFGIAHGGILFSLADSAFAFACNSDGYVTVALDVSVSFPKAVRVLDKLKATAKRIHKTNRTGLYLVEVLNERKELVGLFKGTCYRTEKQIM